MKVFHSRCAHQSAGSDAAENDAIRKGYRLCAIKLAENPIEAIRLAYSGRTWPSLKESKTFDRERLEMSPLFERKLF